MNEKNIVELKEIALEVGKKSVIDIKKQMKG